MFTGLLFFIDVYICKLNVIELIPHFGDWALSYYILQYKERGIGRERDREKGKENKRDKQRHRSNRGRGRWRHRGRGTDKKRWERKNGWGRMNEQMLVSNCVNNLGKR